MAGHEPVTCVNCGAEMVERIIDVAHRYATKTFGLYVMAPDRLRDLVVWRPPLAWRFYGLPRCESTGPIRRRSRRHRDQHVA